MHRNQQIAELLFQFLVKAADHAEIEKTDPTVRNHKDIPRVWITVKHAVNHHLFQQVVGDHAGQFRA